MILGVVVPLAVPDHELAQARSGRRFGTGPVCNLVVVQRQKSAGRAREKASTQGPLENQARVGWAPCKAQDTWPVPVGAS